MSNIYNLCKFLEKKKGTKTPFNAKLLYAPDEITDKELNIKGDLDLYGSIISFLPDNLKVGGDLDIGETGITSIPDNLQVEGTLLFDSTPLAEKYTDEEIIEMIEDKGGYVKGGITRPYR